MARTLTTSSASDIIALCEQGIYEPWQGSEPLDLLARGMVESATGDLETAKDLLSEACRLAPSPWNDKAAVQLAVAYWRGGEKAEASALLDTLPEGFDVLLTRAIIETDSDPRRALQTLSRAEEYDASPYMWGRLHNQRGICFRKLGEKNKAAGEYHAALYLFGDCPLRTLVEKNLGGSLEPQGSHSQLDLVIKSLRGPYLAQAYDLKARTFLSEGKALEADEYARKAIAILEKTDRRAWLADALFTYSEALISQGFPEGAIIQLTMVWEIGEYLGDGDLKFRAAQMICTITRSVLKTYHLRSVEMALNGADSLRSAARKLGISHKAVQDFMKVHHLEFNPQKTKRNARKK